MTTDNVTEAPAIAFTNIKTPNGFYWSFTMRTDTVGKLVEQIETMEEVFKTKGWEAQELRASFGKKKEQEYVEGKVCPKDGGRLVKKVTKAGKPYHKCENGKWNPVTNQATGCDYVLWNIDETSGEKDTLNQMDYEG